MQNIRLLPGILTEVLEILKHKVETMQDIEKDRVLFMDEMEISQGFEHDRSLNCLFDGTSLPESTANVANLALVFDWRFIKHEMERSHSTDVSLFELCSVSRFL